jgi:predicted enzyme related to lactoylglutathione lyase
MQVESISIQLASQNREKLVAFYRDVVQLPVDDTMGEIAFKLGAAGTLFIVDHSEVAGPTKERARSILDLHVTGIEAEHERLAAAGVKFSREKGVEFWGGIISTFNDPDGNTIQLMEWRPELAREENAPAVALA